MSYEREVDLSLVGQGSEGKLGEGGNDLFIRVPNEIGGLKEIRAVYVGRCPYFCPPTSADWSKEIHVYRLETGQFILRDQYGWPIRGISDSDARVYMKTTTQYIRGITVVFRHRDNIHKHHVVSALEKTLLHDTLWNVSETSPVYQNIWLFVKRMEIWVKCEGAYVKAPSEKS